MLQLWKKKKPKKGTSFHWDPQAERALNQAAAQVPLPGLMKNQLRKQLASSAEREADRAGRTNVTPEDLMAGLMSKLPADMRNQIEQAAKQGPAGLHKLQKKLSKKK